MLVKIRLRSSRSVQPRSRKNQHAALALASLLIPAAVMAYVLAGWRVAADLNMTGQFPITEGLFSHWQVWGAGAAVVNMIAIAAQSLWKSKAGDSEANRRAGSGSWPTRGFSATGRTHSPAWQLPQAPGRYRGHRLSAHQTERLAKFGVQLLAEVGIVLENWRAFSLPCPMRSPL